MRFLNLARQYSPASPERDIFGHWIWAIPVILIVAALAFRRVDYFPPSHDEFRSLTNSGWIFNRPYSPVDVLQSLARVSPIHTPFYFILLNAWGHLVGYDVVLGRTLTIFTALLALAMMYRLAHDLVGPVAGLFAVATFASNAFYNFYVPHVRMYPLLVLICTFVLWLYLRIMHHQKEVKRTEYLSLFAGCLVLAYTHAFSALFFAAVGAYHLIVAPKNRRWVWVSAAAALAILAFSPWITVLATDIENSARRSFDIDVNGWIGLSNLLALMLNNGPHLLLLSMASIMLALAKGVGQFKPIFVISLTFVAAFGVTAQVTPYIELDKMRYFLTGLPLITLVVAAGLSTLYRIRKWLGLLVLLWVVAGISYQQSNGLANFVSKSQIASFRAPAWHAVSRHAIESGSPIAILGYRTKIIDLPRLTYDERSQFDHYYGDHGITFDSADSLRGFEEDASFHSVSAPTVWAIYRAATVRSDEVAELTDVMERLDYNFCASDEVGYDTVILQYRWTLLGCGTPVQLLQQQTGQLDYELYGLSYSEEGEQILFVDRWVSLNDFTVENYQMSHQLINDDWEMVAQLDVPLVHEDKLRQFSVYISDVPPGNYRLMAILYNAQTGERVPWIDNPGYVPEMLNLGEVVLE